MSDTRSPFTVHTAQPLPVVKDGGHWWFTGGERVVRLSNLDKPYWPEEGYTKGDLIAYYHAVAPTILPYLADRPLTMKRMPDGAGGPHFYEKNAPSHTPDWMPRCPVPSEDSDGGRIDFLMVDDTAALLFVVNLGCIEFHPLHSRCSTVDQPDYLFFDLDPFPPATFDDVLAVAHHVRAALDALSVPAYPKTSGATGMQIYVPIEPGPSYEVVRGFVAAIGRAILQTDPARVTMDWDISKRTGKVFIDHNMNRRGANIAAVYSVRPEAAAPVSTPLTWAEVDDAEVRPQDFTITTVHDRLARVGDLFRPVLDAPVDLRPALDAVGLSAEPQVPRRPLDAYEAKRDFTTTPEPPAQPGTGEGNSFVVQKHSATRLHYDLRLERGGVLVSWAVPKGLPTQAGDRRLAVPTEDHPLSYAAFEGWIPQGEYGGGEVRIFDRGTYETLEWTDDKITVRLHGDRLRGEYHLAKTSKGWLVFLSSRSAATQPAPPPEFRPMLAEGGGRPFDDPGWRFEPKLDGVRTLAYVTTDSTRLVSRSGRDHTSHYPELGNLAERVNALNAVLDGEIVALDEHGRPSFERLQQRINLTSATQIDRIRHTVGVHLFCFDVLWIDGRDVTSEPLEERRRLLEEVFTEAGSVALVRYVDGEGRAFFEAAQQLGLEGMIAKRLASPYQQGRRSSDWRKVKATRTQHCVILGWTQGTGSRSGTFGALIVGAYEGDTLHWTGNVGTGFDAKQLDMLLERLQAIEVDSPPVDDPALRALKGARWVRPDIVCEVTYLERTEAGRFRAPVFKGLRPDLEPSDCQLPSPRS